MIECLFRMNPSLVKYLLAGQIIQPSVSNVIISYRLSGLNSALFYFHILVQFKICLGLVLSNHTTYMHQLAKPFQVPLSYFIENAEAYFLKLQTQLLDASGMNLKRDGPEIM